MQDLTLCIDPVHVELKRPWTGHDRLAEGRTIEQPLFQAEDQGQAKLQGRASKEGNN